MAHLLDTSVLIHAARDSAAYRAIDSQLGLFRGGFAPVISIITQGEVFAFGKKRKWGEAKMSRLAELIERLVVLPVSEASLVDRYADLEAENELKGLNIGQNDLWIAATAVDYNLTLLTTDADFERCPPPLKYIRFDAKTGAEIGRR